MKSKLTCLILLMSLSGFSQRYKSILVADETTIKQLKYSFIVNTCNDSIFNLIQTRFNVNVTDYYRKKRKSFKTPYFDYTIRFRQTQLTEVEQYLKSL